MASRFIFHKFSSALSRSTSLLGAAASSSARAATTPATLTNVFHRDTVRHLSNHGIHNFAWTEISKAAWQAKDAAFKPKAELPVYDSITKDTDTTICLLAFSCLGWIYIFNRTPPGGSSGRKDGSSCCSHCCNCQCHGPNSKVEQD